MDYFSGVRPFVCKICDKRFFEKSNLIHHGKVHNKPPKPPKAPKPEKVVDVKAKIKK